LILPTAKRKKLDEKLAELKSLADAPEVDREAVVAYLNDKSNFVVAKAVEGKHPSSSALLARFGADGSTMRDPRGTDTGTSPKYRA